MNKIFNAEQFISTKWDSAEQKAKFANQFVKFVDNGFKESDFPEWFYKRLSMCFSHIAHYNRQGFFDTFFTSISYKIDFIRQTLDCDCYGDSTFTYSDVERVLKQWMEEKHILSTYQLRLSEVSESVERAEYERLKVKYGGK